MATAAERPAGAVEGARPAVPTWVSGIVLAILAAALCAVMLSRHHMLFGQSEYDDAVYFGSAVRLVHGVIPYRDFVLVQPPGMQLLLAPFAFLSEAIGTRDAFGAARLVLPFVAAAQVLLVWVILRHRGAMAVTVAGAVVALHTAALSATHTILLEPTVCVLVLAALAVAFDDGELCSGNRLLIAGALIGLAVAVKLVALLALLALALVCLPRWVEIARIAAGAVVGFAAPVVAFVVMAPRQFWHQVIWSQFYRTFEQSAAGRNTLIGRIPARVAGMVGLSGWSGGGTGTTPPTWLTAVVALAVVAFVAGAYLLRARPFTRLDAAALAGTGLVGATLVLSREIYYHYYDFLVPYLGLMLGCAASCYTAAGPRFAAAWQRWRHPDAGSADGRRLGGRHSRLGLLIGAGLALVAIGLATAGQVGWISQMRGGDISGAVDAVVPAGACVLDTSPALLVISDRFVSTHEGCPQIVDATGIELSYATASHEALALVWLRALKASDYLIVPQIKPGRIPLDAAARRYIRRNFHPAPRAALEIGVRNAIPR
jgi:hypothetical protein